MVTASLIVALCWVLPFALGGRFRLGASRARRAWLSAAGGTAIAYVFVDLLPEMQRMQELFSAAAAGRAFPFPHYRVYTAALAGFVFFYALENLAAATRPAESEGEQNRPLVYGFHVGGFAVYCGLMGYLLRQDADDRALAIWPYGLAMFCHFWIVDHSLRVEHGRQYDRSGRWIIAAGILAGWTVAAMGAASDLIVPTLMGIIAGGVVINSVKEELPEKGHGRVVPFVAGAFGYALLLLLLE